MLISAHQAAARTDEYLEFIGQSRNWLHWFWENHVPDDCRSLPSADESAIMDVDDALVNLVIDIQQFVYGDVADDTLGVEARPATVEELTGHLDLSTERRMLTWLEMQEEDLGDAYEPVEGRDHILFAGEPLYVDGGVVISTMDEDPSHDMNLQTTKKYGKIKGSKPWKKPVDQLINQDSKWASMLGFLHWDVCSSAAKCFRILRNRKLASTGCFDNPNADGDSVFWQFIDPGLRYGFHGGEANKRAVFSADLSNAVSLKYADGYEKKVGIPRPKLLLSSRGKLGDGKGYLGMYLAQIRSLLYVLKAVSERTGYELVFPHPHKVGMCSMPKGYGRLWLDGFSGVATHRDLPTTTKWDVRGLQEQVVRALLSDKIPMRDFPSLVEDWKLHDTGWGSWSDEFDRTCVWGEVL